MGVPAATQDLLPLSKPSEERVRKSMRNASEVSIPFDRGHETERCDGASSKDTLPPREDGRFPNRRLRFCDQALGGSNRNRFVGSRFRRINSRKGASRRFSDALERQSRRVGTFSGTWKVKARKGSKENDPFRRHEVFLRFFSSRASNLPSRMKHRNVENARRTIPVRQPISTRSHERSDARRVHETQQAKFRSYRLRK